MTAPLATNHATNGARPRHQLIIDALEIELGGAVRRSRAGRTLAATAFVCGNGILRPSLALLRNESLAALDLDESPLTVTPELAVEVVAPGEGADELEDRINAYPAAGVAEVWVIHPRHRHLYIHSPGQVRQLRHGDSIHCPLLPGWDMPVRSLFEI